VRCGRCCRPSCGAPVRPARTTPGRLRTSACPRPRRRLARGRRRSKGRAMPTFPEAHARPAPAATPTDRPHRVAIVCDGIGDVIAGSFISTIRFAELLKARGHRISFISSGSLKRRGDREYRGMPMHSSSRILLAVRPVAAPIGTSSLSPVRGPMLRGLILAIALVRPILSSAQAAPSPSPQTSTDQEGDSSDKRIWGIIPNYRTSPTLQNYQPLTARDKWKLTADAAFAAKGQYYQDTPAFGQGFRAYGRYFAASTADFVVGDVMTEGVFPVL